MLLKNNSVRSGILTIIVFAALLFNQDYTYGQMDDISFSAGLSTSMILGDNANNSRISPRYSNEPFGGGFDGQQIGFGARLIFKIDDKKRFSVPLGIDYEFFNALERVPRGPNAVTLWDHNTQIITGIIGFNYSFVKFPFANVRAYAGLEARGAFIHNGEITNRDEYYSYDEVRTTTKITKDAAFRLGSVIRIGIEGDIVRPIYLNASLGFGVLNLIGRDDSRGELLTPNNILESKESMIYLMSINMMLQYKI